VSATIAADRSRALGQVTIDNLPDNVLLEIFDFYTERSPFPHAHISPSWKRLTQVCRRWRFIVLESPRRLDLRVISSDRTPTRASLDIWPPFPIIIFYYRHPGIPSLAAPVDEQGVQNLIAALEHRDRTFEIFFAYMEVSVFENLVTVMQEPLPALTKFYVKISDELHVAPRDILGRICPTPRIIIVRRHCIPFTPQINLVCHSHHRSWPIPHPGFWVHFTRGHGHMRGYVTQSRASFHSIPISSISASPNKSTSSDTRSPPCPRLFFLWRR
jgi:hypothetical protein